MYMDCTYLFFFSDVCPLIFPPINLNLLVIQVVWRTSVSIFHHALPFSCKKGIKIPTSIESYYLSVFYHTLLNVFILLAITKFINYIVINIKLAFDPYFFSYITEALLSFHSYIIISSYRI